MAEEKGAGSQIVPAAAPIMVQSENSSFNIGMVLDEKNYDLWAPLIQIHIAGRKKMGYLRGSIKAPNEDDPKYDDWFSEDQKIKSWLLSSMKPEIMKRYIRLSTSKEIWDSLKTAYFDENDEARIYSLNQKASRLRQNGRPLATYFGELTEIFQELDHFNKVSMECENDIKVFQKSTERQRVYVFLGGLDDGFDQVRGEVLRKDPPLGLQASYAYVRREADRKEAMKTEVDKSEPAAMAAKARGSPYGPNREGSQNRPGQTRTSQPSRDRPQGKCPHCGMPGHSKSRCFELIGYPENWDRTRDPRCNKSRASVAETKNDSDQIADKASAMIATAGSDGKALSTSTSVMNNTWIIDSGATEHMTCDSRQVPSLKTSTQTEVNVANGNVVPVIGEGTVSLSKTMKLDTVLVVPSLNYNLLSVAQITLALQCLVIFWPYFCVFKDIRTRKTIGYGIRRGKLYYLELTTSSSSLLTQALSVDDSHGDTNKVSDIWMWHRRLGHASFSYLHKLFPSLFVKTDVSQFKCDVCEMAKSHRTSFPPSSNKSIIPFMIVHSDVWGPSKIPTLGGAHWFVTFIDDCTRMTWVILLKSKSEVSSAFQRFHKMVAVQYNRNIQVLRSDNGGEYVNMELRSFLELHGIVHQTTCPYTPQQNGVAERKNRHLLEMVRASLIEAHLPLHYWGEALMSAAYLINRLPSRTINFHTPFQELTSQTSSPPTPNLPPRTLGCVAFVHLHPHQRHNKLEPRAIRCVFLGYATTQKGYRCYHPSSKKMFITQDVIFHENEMFFGSPTSSLQGEYRSSEVLTRDNTEVLTFDYSHVARNELHEEQPLQSSRMEYTAPREGQQSTCHGDQLTTSGDGQQPVCFGHQSTEQVPEEQQTLQEEEEHPIGPTGFGLDDELQPTICNGTEQQLQQLPRDFPSDVISDPSINSSYLNSHNQSSSTPDATPLRRLPERINRGIPKPTYEADPKCKHKYSLSEPKSDSRVRYPLNNYVSTCHLSESNKSFVYQLSTVSIPNSVQEALADSRWKDAMNEELRSLKKNATWEITDLPAGKKSVGCKWVYTIKYKADGTVDRFKARLVAKGYTQKYGIDYTDTFAPVAKINTVRVLLSLAANLDWPLQQFDVKNAFLHGDLTEEIYMDLPPGLSDPDIRKQKVCRLKKSLYGLKQSPRAWFGRFTKSMRAFGYMQSNWDHTLFLKRRNEKVTALIVYVDDMVVTGNDPVEQAALKIICPQNLK
ncbi:hypothetical protein Prudu_011666 [Prunus dulcis]|uniref:Integrase catalytic domain-containing protein n=1 Tax=Prunus dulcis TaxID=3755 RepID=A0A4Y1RB31_PRUDU|nr:hypothetical protein Prudu_011666 [Prunus dulcis]